MWQACRYFSRILPSYRTETYVQIMCSLHGNPLDYHTAGLIVIGDEILKAQVKDTNSAFMCKLLYDCGVKVKKISVISDNVQEITNEISHFSQKYTYVVTSGGIGPTHDDVTYEALGKAFDSSFHYHPTLVDIVKEEFKIQDRSSPAFKIAYIPKDAELKFGHSLKTGKKLRFPCVTLKNVYVFPGSPWFFEESFGSLYKELFGTNRHFVKKEIFLNAAEETFADALTEVSKEFPQVTFGSYPETAQCYYKVRVTVESDNISDTMQATERFCSLAPTRAVVDYDRAPEEDPVAKYQRFSKNHPGKFYDDTVQLLEGFYKEPKKVAILIGSSIKSTVLLHLAHIALHRLQSDAKLQVVYRKPEEVFPEIEEFVKNLIDRYGTELTILETNSEELVDKLALAKPEVKILLVGSKTSEFGAEPFKDIIKSTLTGPIEIKYPLANWSVDHVWTIARALSLPYCRLYDEGL
ncbi:FAD synthase isoform X2 [Orussus abietinus]|uniref:FAD synthase isoform X2 n=1 Tax=Orussus abietinus TaxID=222816 RepID=UPI000625F41B|nr:FAD synthase isoform X2 [Orussus abietinus]